MRNIKLTIEYDGKDFNGWQKQPNKLNIQGEIERAIEGVTKEKVELYASGRTDAGVHAFGQVANFKTNSSIPINKMATAINSQLKYSIRIKNAEEVDIGFHSRYNCKEKTYAYVINNEEQASAIFRNMEYHFPKKLDVEKMKEYIVELWNRKWHGSQKLFTTDDIVINKESAVNDDRIGWEDSMYVCVKRMGSEDYIKEYGVPQCIGICATKYKK